MALLVTSGRIALAAALKERPIHVAWGRGAAWWGQTDVVVKTFSGSPSRIQLDHAPIESVIVRDAVGVQAFTAPTDYTYDLNTGSITRVAGGGIPSGATVQVQVKYGAPNVTSEETNLVDEVGRRLASAATFVVRDPQGSLPTSEPGVNPGEVVVTRWAPSDEPTTDLYVSALFDFMEAPNEIIREVAVFVDTVPADDVPPGRLYLTPAEVKKPGYMMLLDRGSIVQRDPSTRNGFSYVLEL